MFLVLRTKKFRKKYRKIIKNSKFNEDFFFEIIQNIATGSTLNKTLRDHPLSGDMKGRRECHIYPDILLIYKKFEDENLVVLHDIGSHSDLF